VLPEQAHAGRNRVVLELDSDEIHQTVSLLRHVLAAARDGHGQATASGQREGQATHNKAVPAPRAPAALPASSASSSALPLMQMARTWNSPPAEHQNVAVSALSWHQSADCLEGRGDAHAGWLFSASKGCLNLWECQPGGGVGGEPGLSLMHCQAISHRPTCLEVDASSSTLLTAAADARSGAEPAAVCRHTLRTLDFMSMAGALKPPKPIGGGKLSPGAPLLAHHCRPVAVLWMDASLWVMAKISASWPSTEQQCRHRPVTPASKATGDACPRAVHFTSPL